MCSTEIAKKPLLPQPHYLCQTAGVITIILQIPYKCKFVFSGILKLKKHLIGIDCVSPCHKLLMTLLLRKILLTIHYFIHYYAFCALAKQTQSNRNLYWVAGNVVSVLSVKKIIFVVMQKYLSFPPALNSFGKLWNSWYSPSEPGSCCVQPWSLPTSTKE